MDSAMDRERWERLQQIFARVVDLPVEARDAAIAVECGDDADLRTLVVRLLHEDAQDAPLLDAGVAAAARDLLGDGDGPLRFGPYVVLSKINEGGMGVVYLAERPDLHQRVAIKVLNDAWVSPARRDRFTQEQQALARLNHPSIARLYDAATLPDGTPYFVMEYVDGTHLTAYCNERELAIDARVTLFRDCCEAVRHAHQHLLIHRDLKPSNIMVTASGAVKLLDFGIAKQIESVGAPAEQTQVFRPFTRDYAAPEQVRGEPVGVFTDVYSLGVILYELLAGRLPVDRNATSGDEPVAAPEPPPPASVAARSAGRSAAASRSAWADLDVICATAVHSDRTRRYLSVEALMRDCDHYLRGEPIEARPDSVAYRTRKFVRRHAAALTAAALAVLALGALAAFYTVRVTAARNEAVAESAIRQRVQAFMLSLFDADESSVAPSDDLRVVTLVDRGVREAQTLDGDPRVQSELFMTLGQVYQRLGNLPQANALLQRSLDKRRDGATSAAELMESTVALGLLRLAQGQPQEAARLVAEGLEIGKRRLAATDPKIGRATVALGMVYDALDDRDKAIPMLQDAVRLFDVPGPPTQDLAEALTALANSLYYAGRLDESESLNRRVLEIDRVLHGPDHPAVADRLINLGTIEFDRGRHPDAERLRRQALGILDAWYGPAHPETASAQRLLAQALSSQGRTDEALALLKRALATNERSYQPAHPRTALVLNDLGIVHQVRQEPGQASEYYRRAIALFRVIYPDGHSRTAVAEGNLGAAYLALDDYVRAEETLSSALREMTRVYPDDHLTVAIARARLGAALAGQKRFREAEAPLLAGYDVLTRKTNASATWLQRARLDLAAVYTALGQPEKARRYRDEHAAVQRTLGQAQR